MHIDFIVLTQIDKSIDENCTGIVDTWKSSKKTEQGRTFKITKVDENNIS